MHYIIDAYNLFFRLEKQTAPLAKKREEFLQCLVEEMELCRLSATLIFDSGSTHTSPFPSTKSLKQLQITFSPHGISADEYILECLKIKKFSQNTTLVTSDKDLGKKGRSLGAKTMTVEGFLELVQAKKKRNKKYMDDKQLFDSKKNIARLQLIFEENLRKKSSD